MPLPHKCTHTHTCIWSILFWQKGWSSPQRLSSPVTRPVVQFYSFQSDISISIPNLQPMQHCSHDWFSIFWTHSKQFSIWRTLGLLSHGINGLTYKRDNRPSIHSCLVVTSQSLELVLHDGMIRTCTRFY